MLYAHTFNTFFIDFRYLEAGSQVKGYTRTEQKLLESQLLSSEVEVLPSFTDDDVHRRHSEREVSRMTRLAAQAMEGKV